MGLHRNLFQLASHRQPGVALGKVVPHVRWRITDRSVQWKCGGGTGIPSSGTAFRPFARIVLNRQSGRIREKLRSAIEW